MLHPSTEFAMDTAHHAQNAIKLIHAAIRIIQVRPDTGIDLLSQAADINLYLKQMALLQSRATPADDTPAAAPEPAEHLRLSDDADDEGADDLRNILDGMRDMARETDAAIEIYDR